MKITIQKNNIINQLLENTGSPSMNYNNNVKSSTVQAKHLTDRPTMDTPGKVVTDSTTAAPKIDSNLSKRRQYAGFEALKEN
jgi:hypothetical protein